MKTTPKPKATKNSRGELVGPPPLLWFPLAGELVAAGGADGVVIEGAAELELVISAVFLKSLKRSLIAQRMGESTAVKNNESRPEKQLK